MHAVNRVVAFVDADSELAEFLFAVLKAETLANNIEFNRTRAVGPMIYFDFKLKQPIYRIAR